MLSLSMSFVGAELCADACPALCGDDAAHAANRERRRTVLRFVDASQYAISVVHSEEWSEPELISFAGLRLLQTDTEHRPRQALIEVGGELEEFGCAEGRYVMKRDDTIGPDTSILAILDGIVLVEHLGSLRYVHVDDVAVPTFSMGWRSPWPMNPYLFRGTTPLRPAPAKRR
jgi:hypothetical protein